MEKVSGVVTKRVDLGDSDVIVTIFTKEKGKIQLVAKGAKKPKSPFMGSTQIFCYGNYVYYPGKNIGYLNQSELIASFYKLRYDLEKLSAASYFVDIINTSFEEYDKDERILSLLLHCLNLLESKHTKDIKTVILAYQLKFTGLLGYRPVLEKCTRCQLEKDEYYFSIKQGGLICSSCKAQFYENQITEDGIKILSTLLYIDIKKIGQLDYNKDLLKYLIKLMNDYISYYIDKRIYSFDFMETIE